MAFKLFFIVGMSLTAFVFGIPQKGDVNIEFNENGRKLTEKVIFDDQNETTEYVIEAKGTRVLVDHRTGLSVMKITGEKKCFLMKDEYGDTNAKIRHRLNKLGRKVPDDVKDTKNFKGTGSLIQPGNIPLTIQQYCGSFPIYRLYEEGQNIQDESRQKRGCNYVTRFRLVCVWTNTGRHCYWRAYVLLQCYGK
ncbi:uncharacterized protein [Clytia hemisphaerica]|uniref:Cnidarian restricted protein n=1 Tax=Clytia hemisphaerica TaxID=252671 RepID=A0A7M5WYU0_9CNID